MSQGHMPIIWLVGAETQLDIKEGQGLADVAGWAQTAQGCCPWFSGSTTALAGTLLPHLACAAGAVRLGRPTLFRGAGVDALVKGEQVLAGLLHHGVKTSRGRPNLMGSLGCSSTCLGLHFPVEVTLLRVVWFCMWDGGGAGMLLFGMKEIRNEDGSGSEGRPWAHSQCLVLLSALSESQDAYICSIAQRGAHSKLVFY